MAFIPMPYTVQVHRPGRATGEVDDHGNEIMAPPTTFDVAAAGWAEPGDEAVANAREALRVELSCELLADSGRVDLGDTVTIDGRDFRAVTRKNYDFGPFGFTPGLDVIGLTRVEG